MKALSLSEEQAQAILDMPLKRLSSLERRRLSDELKEKQQEIKHLKGLLRSPTKIRAVIRQDLLTLVEQYGDERRTRIVDQEKGHHTARDLVQAEDILITLLKDDRVVRSAKAPRVSAKAVPLAQMWGNTRDDIAFFWATGQAAMVPLHQVADGSSTTVGGLTDLRTGAPITALVLPHPQPDEERLESYLTLITRSGRIKRISVHDFASAAGRGTVTAMAVENDDQLLWVLETGGREEIMLITRQGKAIRFAETDVRPMGLAAAGVMAVKLGTDDAVVGAGVVRDGESAVIFTEKGFAKRTALRQFPTQKRYGGGVQAIKLSSRTGPVSVAALAGEKDALALVTSKGRLTKLPAEAIHSLGRAAAGYGSRKDTKEKYLDYAKNGPPVLLTVLAGTLAAARKASAQAPGTKKAPSKSPPSKSRKPSARKATSKATSKGSRSTRRKKG